MSFLSLSLSLSSFGLISLNASRTFSAFLTGPPPCCDSVVFDSNTGRRRRLPITTTYTCRRRRRIATTPSMTARQTDEKDGSPADSVTRFDDLLDLRQLFNAFGNN